MTNTEELVKLIKLSGLKKSYLAKKLGITVYSLKKKIENVTEFKASEIYTLSKLLNINSIEHRDNIFLSK